MLLTALLAALAVFGIGFGLNLAYTTPGMVQSVAASMSRSQNASSVSMGFRSRVSSGDFITVSTAWYSNAPGSVESVTQASGTAKLGTVIRLVTDSASGGNDCEEVEIWFVPVKGSGSLTLEVNFSAVGDVYVAAAEISGITSSGLGTSTGNGTLSGSPTDLSVTPFTPPFGSYVVGVASFDGAAGRSNPSAGNPSFALGSFGPSFQKMAAEEFAVNWDGSLTSVPIVANPDMGAPYAWCEAAVYFPPS